MSEAKLCDFGLAKIRGESQTNVNSTLQAIISICITIITIIASITIITIIITIITIII